MLNEKKLAEAVNAGLSNLVHVLKSKTPTKEEFMQARIASSILATSIRLEAARNARLGMMIRVASSVMTDKEERRQYLASSQPELKLLK